jgi:hypothetical protein
MCLFHGGVPQITEPERAMRPGVRRSSGTGGLAPVVWHLWSGTCGLARRQGASASLSVPAAGAGFFRDPGRRVPPFGYQSVKKSVQARAIPLAPAFSEGMDLLRFSIGLLQPLRAFDL